MTDTRGSIPAPDLDWPEAEDPTPLVPTPLALDPTPIGKRALLHLDGAGWLRDFIVTAHPYRSGRDEIVQLATEQDWWTHRLTGAALRTIDHLTIDVYLERPANPGEVAPSTWPREVAWRDRVLPDGWSAPPIRRATKAHDAGPLVGRRLVVQTAKGPTYGYRAITEPVEDETTALHVSALPTRRYYEALLGLAVRERAELALAYTWVE